MLLVGSPVALDTHQNNLLHNNISGLHTTLAYHDVNALKNQVNFEHFTGRIEAAHFDDSAFFVTFVAQIGYKPAISAIDPQLQALVEDSQFQGPTQELYLLDNDGDDLPGKLELYIKRMAASFYEQEPSPFMRPTLMLASEMCQSKKVSQLVACVSRFPPNNRAGPPSGACFGALGGDPYSGGC
jgi:hypothetical protein